MVLEGLIFTIHIYKIQHREIRQGKIHTYLLLQASIVIRSAAVPVHTTQFMIEPSDAIIEVESAIHILWKSIPCQALVQFVLNTLNIAIPAAIVFGAFALCTTTPFAI